VVVPVTEDQERRHLLVVLDLWIALLEMEIRNTAAPPAPPRRLDRFMDPSWLERKAS